MMTVQSPLPSSAGKASNLALALLLLALVAAENLDADGIARPACTAFAASKAFWLVELPVCAGEYRFFLAIST
jgi:hypothetical protein